MRTVTLADGTLVCEFSLFEVRDLLAAAAGVAHTRGIVALLPSTHSGGTSAPDGSAYALTTTSMIDTVQLVVRPPSFDETLN